MRKLFSISALAAAAAFAVLGTARAADMPLKAPPPLPPPPTWTGTYLGINGGWGWGTTNHTDTFGLTTGDFDQDGGLAGVTWGGNWQIGHYVLGLESDLDWADIKGTFTSAALCSVTGGNTCFTTVKSLSSERVRAGYDLNGWLLYVTGGAGFARVKAGQEPCVGLSCRERWRAGWTAGAGVETKFAPNWSAKIEYLHYDFGDNVINYSPPTPVFVTERVDTIRVGINYFFDFTHLLP